MSQVAHFWGLLVWGLRTVACRHLTLERRFQELQKIVQYDSMTRYCERECKVFGGSGKENLPANAGDTGSILVHEDPPCTTTIESVPLSLGTTTAETPMPWGRYSATREATAMRSPRTTTRE